MDVHQRRIGVFREKPGSDIVKQGYLKKLKTNKKKYFVLRSTSSSGPARLDYYDSEKKFKSVHPPKRSIPLHTCFNINKKKDLKHKFAIALFLMEDCFSVVAETEEDRDTWLYHLLEYQNEYLVDGEQPRTHYELVWQGVVKQKPPKSCHGIVGPYRLCVSDKSVCLVKVKEFQPSYTFQFSSIRRCGHTDNSFFMEVGRSSITGAGELWMQVDETSTAESMHSAVREEMHNSRSNNPDFRRRSNTGSSNMGPIRSSVMGEDSSFPRKRATSESHSNTQGSPRKNRANVLHRPQSTVVYSRSNMLSPESPLQMGTSPGKSFEFHVEDGRIRSDSMGSSVSRKSHHSDALEPPYENVPNYPMTPENSYSISSHHSIRSGTPETSFASTDYGEENMDTDYLPMTPGQRSMTPSPTRGHATGGDYLSMTPGLRSGTPSPTRHTERPGSAGSDGQELSSRSEGYMDMQPGSLVSSPASSHSSYMPMTPPASNNSGYMDMTPGQKTPTEPTSHGYMVMDGGWARTTAPIPIRANKEPGYMDMGPSSQTLPTVKEGGSGEAYLPMSPTQQSPVSSAGLRPAKVISYLSDDSMSGEFPKRAYSVGSRPAPKSSFRYQPQEFLRRQPLDNSRSSSAPHLIVQKTRSQHLDMYRNMNHDQSQCVSPLSQSVKSDDCDSFMEMDFYRPRTASDSYGSRQRSSSFGKQFIQGHRPRSSSYGQASRGKLAKIASTGRTDSFESIRTTSQELSNRHRSQESLGKFSSSSRNSSSESLKKLSEELKHKKSGASDYMDMGFEKRKTPSPSVHGVISPKVDTTGYVDMSLGTSAPKSSSRGISPSSSSHSLGSSPASIGHGYYDKGQDTKIVKASGKAMQKQTFTSQLAQPSESQLKLSAVRIKKSDKRSPSSSGKESEDESYVPFQPITAAISHDDVMFSMSNLAREPAPRSHPGLKVQHSYSKSFDSAVRDTKNKTPNKHDFHLKVKSEEKHRSKSNEDKKAEKESKSSKQSHKQNRSSKKHEAATAAAKAAAAASSKSSADMEALQEKVSHGHSPTLEEKEFIPETDLFSNKVFQGPAIVSEGSLDTDSETVADTSPTSENKSPEKKKQAEASSGDTSAYMEYCPGIVNSLDTPAKTTRREGTLTKEVSIEPQRVSTRPIRQVERDYCEIDLPPTKSVDTSNSARHKAKIDNSGDNKVVTAKSSGMNEGDNFSYMDFDPDMEKSEAEEKAMRDFKSPNPVRSFVAHGPAEARIKPPVCIVETSVVSHVGADKKSENSDPHKGIIRALSSSDNKENMNTNNVSMVGGSVQSKDIKTTLTDVRNKEVSGRVVQFDQIGDNKTVIGENAEEKVKNAKFVVRRTSAQNEPEVVEDEGYVDLDFSEVKSHKRSSSSSSSNSEKSRRISIDTGASGAADDIPCPETPISYICDDSDAKPCESSVVVREPGSPYKHSGNAQGFLYKSASARMIQTASHGNGTVISRQCSVPIGTAPGIASRSSMEIQSGRCRKASGPAGYPPSSKSAGIGGAVGKRSCSTSSQLGLDPVPAGQELQKQKSMPCMNIEKKRVSENFQEIGQSRHSFSDLSQYEEMSFPPEKLDKNKGKSHSQQQLSDSSQEKVVLNYAELELHGSSENVEDKSPRISKSRHPSSIEDLTAQGDLSPVSYAEIDYLKTESMKNSGNKEVKFTI